MIIFVLLKAEIVYSQYHSIAYNRLFPLSDRVCNEIIINKLKNFLRELL